MLNDCNNVIGEGVEINVHETNFHPILKDVEIMFWFFLLSTRTLSDPDVQSILRTKNAIQAGYQCFNDMLDKFNEVTNLKIEKIGNNATSKLNISKAMIFIGKAMAVFACELLSVSDYYPKISEIEEFKFLKHIRNGAAHNNKFNFRYKNRAKKRQWSIGETEIIKWNGLEIGRKLQDTNVFNDFISIFGIFLLINFLSKKLYELDKARV